MASVTVRPEYRADVYVVRVDGEIIDTIPDRDRAYALANRLADVLDVIVNAD